MPNLVECIPNVSEGRDPAVIEAVAASIRAAGVPWVHVDGDIDHHRTVYTFAGSAPVVLEAAWACVREAARRIDLAAHDGIHPRVGAADVVPFVPLGDTTLPECAVVADALAERIERELGLPAPRYGAGHAALPDVRRTAAPGSVCVGARGLLVAFNVQLESTDLDAARAIARAVRERDGGLPGVRALGFPLATRGCVQVSMNLTELGKTGPLDAFAAVEAEAERRGIAIRDSEIVGLLPAPADTPEFAVRARCRPYQTFDPFTGSFSGGHVPETD